MSFQLKKIHLNVKDNHSGRLLTRDEQVVNSGNDDMGLIKLIIGKPVYHEVHKRSNVSPRKYLDDTLLENVMPFEASSPGDKHVKHVKEVDLGTKNQQMDENHHIPANDTHGTTAVIDNGVIHNNSIQSPPTKSGLTLSMIVSPSLSSAGQVTDALHRQSQSVSAGLLATMAASLQPSSWTSPKHTSGFNGSSAGVSFLHLNSSCECLYLSVCSCLICLMVGEAYSFYLKHCNAILHLFN